VQRKSFDDDAEIVEIEEMKIEHLDQVMAIEKASFVAPWSKRLFSETIAFPRSVNLVSLKKVDKKVVGYANFYLIRGEVQVLNIAVAPDYRKKGYASLLLKHAIRLLGERGAKDVFLEVRESNLDAIGLYEKLGFARIGRRKRYYTETNEDAIVMRLRLEDGSDW
jgi:[ribosomal protein S18]-alanine N-acetyltransferase